MVEIGLCFNFDVSFIKNWQYKETYKVKRTGNQNLTKYKFCASNLNKTLNTS